MNVSSASSMVNLLAEGRAQREKAAQERAETKLRDAQSAVATLKQLNSAASSQASEQRKAAAKQRVDQLKARLQMLKMSGSVDPKVLAQLARELKAAVKSYAGEGGSAAGLGGASVSASAAPTDGASAQAPGADGEVSADPDAAQSAEHNAAQADVAASGDDRAGKDGKEAAANPADPRGETNPYRRMAQEAEVKFAEAARRGAATQADRDFLTEARSLANQIKSLAKSAASKTDPARQRDGAEAEKAAVEALKQVEDAGKDLGASGVSITI
ncbi:hypothetical protein [Brevundimonas sp.]|uniref:hypothetical protein n=1 Tax=Brevundimonas sp. TaxID=1871086 RepID=UPI0025BDA480|nr:hypothetical protein [Brevundimonas sp.]